MNDQDQGYKKALIAASKQLTAWKELCLVNANTTANKKRIEGFITFIRALLNEDVECFITKNNKIAYTEPGASITNTHRQLAQYRDGGKDEKNEYFIRKLKLSDNHQLVIVSKSEIKNDQLGATIKSFYDQLNLKLNPFAYKKLLIAAIIISILFIPVKIPIIGQAYSKGENRLAITAHNSGVVTTNVQPGLVKQGQLIAQIETRNLDDQIEILSSRIQELKTNLEQSTVNDTNVYITRASILSSNAELNGLREQQNRNKIHASQNGVLEWETDIYGRYIDIGQIIGSLDEIEQTLLFVTIAVKDWRPNMGEIGVFSDYDKSQTIRGEIEHTPTIIDSSQGKAEYVIRFRLEEPVTLGVAGIVEFSGEYTNLFKVLFKTPLRYLSAWLMLHQYN